MKKYLVERTRTQEVSVKMRIWSVVLLIGFAIFSVLVYLSKITFNNIMIYLIAIGAYIGFSILFMISLKQSNNPMQIKKRLR
ncbi:hypothetical protein [Chryseobacterium oryctis]|uniref:Uncharacterized protein n=1 Tax=Chryseobacterium oryctis TaxID=2952618 RepID=A0ABT3HQW0_9FLAO|nr:hypothetical protein [Chryseobacterium oryctis]MCW3162172.1 hypothetical protein [Chryseobacterium oryctis]